MLFPTLGKIESLCKYTTPNILGIRGETLPLTMGRKPMILDSASRDRLTYLFSSEVAHSMRLHVTLLGESLITYVARERLLACVRCHVTP